MAKKKKPAAVAAAHGLRDASFSDAAPTSKIAHGPQGSNPAAASNRRIEAARAFAEAAKGIIETRIYTEEEVSGLRRFAQRGEPRATAIVDFIDRWKRDLDTKPTCFTCGNVVFSRALLPGAFSIGLPYANVDRGTVAGICRDCAERDDLLDRVIAVLKKIWRLDIIQGGSA